MRRTGQVVFHDARSFLETPGLTHLVKHPDATGYCSAPWLAACAQFEIRTGVLTWRSAGEDLLYCPVSAVQKRISGRFSLVVADSFPYGGLGGLIEQPDLDNATRARAILSFLSANHGRAFGGLSWLATRIKTFVRLSRWRALGAPESARWLRLSTLTALRLPASYDELRQHFTTHHRRNVKQAQRAGCQVQVSDSHDDLVEFHALVQGTLGRAGVADVPLPFYAAACRRLIDAGNGHLYLIRDGGRIIAGIFIVSNQRRSFYWLGGLERHESVTAKRPMFLLFDTAFRDAIERGHEEFELGGVPNEGLSRFKLGWGAVAEPFVYVDCLNPALRFAHHLFSRVRGLQRS